MSFDVLTVFGAGILTFLTPCVLPMIPIYLAALTGGSFTKLDGQQRGTLLLKAGLFSLGFILVFSLLGLGASGIGAFLGHNQLAFKALGGALIVLFGLKFLGFISVPVFDRIVKADDRRFRTRFSAVNAFVMGVVFAAGWSPCVGPVLGAVLTYTATQTSDPVVGAGYLALYGMGFALPLLAVAAFAEAGQAMIGRLSPYMPRIEKILGVVLVVTGGMLLFDAARDMGNAPTLPPADTLMDGDLEPTENTVVTGYPTMLELYTEDCSVCQKMSPIMDRITEQCDQKGVRVKTVDVSKAEHRHLVQTYRVRGVPTFVFLDESGIEVSRMVGEQTEAALKQALSVLRNEPCPGVETVSLPPSLPGTPRACDL